MVNKRLTILIECAIFAAIAIILTFIPLNFGSSFSISLGMIPLYIIAMRRGFFAAGFSGLLWGLLHFLTGQAYILTATQAFIEYIVAFSFLAFSGIFVKYIHSCLQKKNLSNALKWAWLAMFIGGVARYFWHYVAGVIFWGEYAFKGWSAQVFSLVMNGASCFATIFFSGIVTSIILKIKPEIFLPKNK